MKCAVGKCNQSNSKKTNVSFYNFPKDAEQRKLWVEFCNRWKPIDVQKEKICALHFKQEDFERNLIFEMGFSSRRAPKLKPGAVPTIDMSAIANEIPNAIANPIEIPNKIEIKNEVEIEIENEFETLTYDENTPIMRFSIRRAQKLKPGAVPTTDTSAIANEIEFPNEIEIANLIEIPNEIETNNEVEIENEFETLTCDEKNTPMLRFSNRRAAELKPGAISTTDSSAIANEIEFPNEIEIPNEVKIPNEIEIKYEIDIEDEEEFIALTCDEMNTPMMTDINEDIPQLYIKTLEMKRDALRQENSMLKMLQSKSAITMKNLSRQVQSLSFANVKLEKALRRLFTEGQLKKLKNGNKRQNFTETDIAQSFTLYSTSAKVYTLLRKKHYPLPSVRTLQRWSQKWKQMK